ncbi:oligosaccharide flippase family protein [Portibacter lacus]|uniref:O-unit flippase n=1 Tax=Portibacter lacus TaxID=1099794 RepID=A0AA37WD66_9BACT|nr:polysaccharide biosynthesis C-terminal domain-containing protein [Portibacter lacus]GLR17576.1 O-unit flippase [Portibacter lacus]
MKMLNRDALESLAIRIPVLIFSFLHSIFIIRLLGPEGNGLLTFILAGVSLSIVVLGFDAKRSTLYHMTKSEFDSAKVVGFSLKVHFLSIFAVTVLILLLYLMKNGLTFIFIPKENLSIFYVLFFIASFIFQHLTALFQTILQAQKDFRTINKFLFFTNLAQVVFYGIGYYYTSTKNINLSFVNGFALVLSMQALTFLTAFFYLKSKYKGGISLSTKEVKKPYLAYTGLGYLNQIGHFLNKRLDIWFIELYVGLKSLGIYALASQLTNFLLLVAAPIEEVLKPYLITLDREEGNTIFVRYFKLIFYFISVLAALLFLISPYLINVLFGEEFSGATTPLRILCLGVVFVNIKRVFLNYNRAYNELDINIWAQWTGVLMTVILDVLLIPKYGLKGAAWASLMAYGISALILMTVFLIRQKVNFFSLWIPTSSDFRYFIKK